MNTIDKTIPVDLINFINNTPSISWNLSPDELTDITIQKNMGELTKNETLAINTGQFTGRAPKDRFIVHDKETEDAIDWGDINIPIKEIYYKNLKTNIINYLETKQSYGRNCFACADQSYKLNITLITEFPWSNIFGYNMFLRLSSEELKDFKNEWTILCAPGYKANPKIDGTRKQNFSIINFTEKVILIGGTGYTGEIKKGIFSVLNYILPIKDKILPMHCSANIGTNNDTTLFFGLSGTGKTTLSADPHRKLIGDDEHGWSNTSIFNFEGGCYAKCINLSQDKEPDIFKAIKKGALLENISIDKHREVDFMDSYKTENTRVSYPINHINNIVTPSIGPVPKNIFFLTADAFGVLPPISKLDSHQAMYHFISGYTSKIAGTEEGIVEPQATFSACFGAPFMPLHPTLYANMLGQKMSKTNVNVWLINTGWSGGKYGVGSRISLKYTRSMISSAMNGKLDNVIYKKHDFFKLNMPISCSNVPSHILDPVNTWNNPEEYKTQAAHLSRLFHENFKKIKKSINNNPNNKIDLDNILLGSPKIIDTI